MYKSQNIPACRQWASKKIGGIWPMCPSTKSEENARPKNTRNAHYF